MNRIALISDLHLKLDGEVYGIDTKSNFLRTLQAIVKWDPAFIVINGDLSGIEPNPSDVTFVKEKLDQLQVPYAVISGNHDDSSTIANVFNYKASENSGSTEVYYSMVIGDRRCVFLDTKKGCLSFQQLNWLKSELVKETALSPLIFMHYPPIITNVPFVDDNHPFLDAEKFQKIMIDFAKPINIFCGHVHVEKTIQFKNMNLHITPSQLTQIDQQEVSFKADHHNIAYRIIELDGEVIRTAVHYL